MSKALGLDLGTRTLGIAESDSAGWYAYGIETFRFNEGNYKAAIQRVIEIAKKDNIEEIALGLPLNMNGTKGERAESCLRFKDQLLEANPNFKIRMIDERMTTMIANLSRNKRKKVIDQQAAVVILESYLARRK